MHALVILALIWINQQTTFVVPSFTSSKYMSGAKFKKRVTWPWVVLLSAV